MLKTCSECKSKHVSDKTATLFYWLTAVLGVWGVIMLFITWPWALLILAGMLTCVVMAVDLPQRKYRCKDCGHEWKEGYNPAGEQSRFSVENNAAN
ncbi:MAG: hypothetical protein EPN37_12330 [Chitinophagaceae bacterium]|nr:MAG: hypothetical protein EPN37_12330 [Chitinophagaceae bacterium]